MRKYLSLSLLLLIGWTGFAITPVKERLQGRKTATETTNLKEFVSLSRSELKKKLGRKLTWKENVGLLVMKRALKKAINEDSTVGDIKMSSFFQSCSRIALKNGDIVEADIIQITPTEVKYKRCGKTSDPEFVVNKDEVFSIQAPDGEIIFRNTTAQIANQSGRSSATYTGERVVEPLSIWAAAASLLIGPIGLILGIISLVKIARNPEKYKGSGWAWAGIILGVLGTIGLIITLSGNAYY